MKSNSSLFPNTSSAKKIETRKNEMQKSKEKPRQILSRLSPEDKKLVIEVKDRGDKITEEDVVFITKDKDGKIRWLEKGRFATKDKRASGLLHILEHASQFNDKGIPNHLIAKAIEKAIKEPKIVGTSGKNRDVYETTINGKVVYIAITISDNGYIVGANPVSNWKEKK